MFKFFNQTCNRPDLGPVGQAQVAADCLGVILCGTCVSIGIICMGACYLTSCCYKIFCQKNNNGNNINNVNAPLLPTAESSA